MRVVYAECMNINLYYFSTLVVHFTFRCKIHEKTPSLLFPGFYETHSIMAAELTEHGAVNYLCMMNALLSCPMCKNRYDQDIRNPIILHKNGYCTICTQCLQLLTNGQACPLCPKSTNIRWRVDLPQDSSANFEAIESAMSSVCPDCANEYDATNKPRCISKTICCTNCLLLQNGHGLTPNNFIIDYPNGNVCPKCFQAYTNVNPARCEQRYIICTQCVRFHICAKKFHTLEAVTTSTCPLCIKVFSFNNPPKIIHSSHVICKTCLILHCFTKRTKRMRRWFWCPICSKPPEKITIPLKFMESNLFIQHLQSMLLTHHIDFRKFGINSNPFTVPSTALPQVDDPHPRKFESYLHCLVSGFHKINSFMSNVEKQMYQTAASGLTHDMNRLVQLKIKSLVNLEHIAGEYVFTLYNLIHKDSAKSLGLRRLHYAMGIPEFPKSLFFISTGCSNTWSSSGAIELKSVENPYVGHTCTIHIRVQNIPKVQSFAICNATEGTPLHISCTCTPHLDFLASNIEHFQITFQPIKPGTHELSISNNLSVSKVTFEVHDLSKCGSQACQNSRCVNCKYMVPRQTFRSHMTNETHQIKQYITCTATNIIYLMQCRKCGVQYVGETGDTMRQRMMQHRCINPPSLAEEHFRLVHGLENLEVIGIEKVSNTEDQVQQEHERLKREAYWIKTLHTHYPLGLNAIHASHPRTPRKKQVLLAGTSQDSSCLRQLLPQVEQRQQQEPNFEPLSDDSDSD